MNLAPTVDSVDSHEYTIDRIRTGAMLATWTRTRLITTIEQTGAIIWTAHPMTKWSKQDLVSELMSIHGWA